MPQEIGKALDGIADLLLDAVLLVDVHGRVVYASAACASVFGYTPSELTGRQLFDLLFPEDRARTWEESLHVLSGSPRIGFENRYIRKDGSIVHVMWSARWDEERQVRIGVARDVTAKKRAEASQIAGYQIAAAAQATDTLEQLFEAVHDIIARLVSVAGLAIIEALTDHRFRILYQWNATGNSSFMYNPVLVGLIHETLDRQQPALAAAAQQCTVRVHSSLLTIPLPNANGLHGALVLQSPSRLSYTSEDQDLLLQVSAQLALAMERRQLIDEVMRSARYDDLTGLPNRKLFYKLLDTVLAQCRRQESRAALLFLDLDGFKKVNDTLGHLAGDELLKTLAARMKQAVREQDTVARIGGDEFVVVLPDMKDRQDADIVAAKIRQVCSEPTLLGQQVFRAMVSIGAAIYPDHGDSSAQLIRHADQEMYKQKGRKP